MTDDIAALIERLRERIHELEAELAEFTKLKEYAKSLGQQTFLEIHAENERLRTGIAFGNDLLPALQERIRELEAERDARVSVELLNIERETCDRIRSDNGRLRVERDKLKAEFAIAVKWHEQERDAIRAKTIEDCAKIADAREKNGVSALYGTPAAIRALAHASTSAQQDESKT